MIPPTICLVDGDLLVYRSGFAAERTKYFVTIAREDDEDSPQFTEVLQSKRELTEYRALYESKIIDVQPKVELEPIENALHNIKSTLNKIMENNHTDDCIVFLSGCTETPNFRYAVDPQYKANRKDARRPTYLPEMQEYLKNTYQTVVTEGMEADDYLAIAAVRILKEDGKVPIICTLDKDLNQIPNVRLYNWVHDTIAMYTEEEAEKNFWKQMLIGDGSDNIRGIKGYGVVRSTSLADQLSNAQLRARVIALYNMEGLDVSRFNANCDLLWIKRSFYEECPHKI